MSHSEVHVGRCEFLGTEGSLVPFVLQLTTEMASPPTWIDKLPYTVVDSTSVPGMGRFERGDWIVHTDGAVPEAFART